jgi:hypothetical protein
MVLIQPKDPAFQMANMKLYSPFVKEVVSNLSPEKIDVFFSLTTINSEPILIEEEMPKFIKGLHNKNVPTIALTALLTGKLLHISNMEEHRMEWLKNLGIHFSENTISSEKIILSNLPSFRGNHGVFIDGALFVNGPKYSKGEALISFLKKISYTPKKIIFVDDREENLKSLETSLQEFDSSIVYTGLLFSGAKDYPSPTISEEQFKAKWLELAKQAESLE